MQTPSCLQSPSPLLDQSNPSFLDAVTGWQRRLGAIDAVLSTWAAVQHKWAALESIFAGSADIRVQLPADSLRFDAVNADYRVGAGWGTADGEAAAG